MSLRQRHKGGHGVVAPPPPSPSSTPEVPSSKTATGPSSTTDLTRTTPLWDGVIVVLLLLVALYIRLDSIENPNRIVFDEVHFTQFATWYNSGNYFGERAESM
jgi:hypothetical protein